jgi:acetyl esterase/lipase
MLVFSSNAVAEANRLSSQAWLIEPTELSTELLTQVANVDGALLLDEAAVCHAFGVILDGPACSYEDPSRGSRYNNAIRYVNSESNPPAVIVIYSSDKSIDVVPKLEPRVARRVVAAAVEVYTEAVNDYINDIDLPTYGPRSRVAQARQRVVSLRFYLNQEQCAQINAARDREREWSSKNSSLQIVEPDVIPNQLMNDSYFLD